MNTEIYIENYRLDVSTDISALLTFALDSLKDFSERTTTFSKTIVLPGTANNNKLFGHIFQIGQSNAYNSSVDNVGYNFNAAKSADCIIFQDQMQTFKGQLRLLQINLDKGRPEYEVAVFGELAGLNVSLSTNKLEDLDFSAYDHVWNVTNIQNSWNTINGTGYYYPLADYGGYSSLKNDWDIRTFRPALYVYEYIDKMFTAAGYRWDSDLFESARFKSLIVPGNTKKLYKLDNNLISATRNSTQIVIDQSLGTDSGYVQFTSTTLNNFSYSGGEFTYTGSNPLTINISVRLKGIYNSVGTDIDIFAWVVGGTIIGGDTLPASGGDTNFDLTFTNSVTVINGDKIRCEAIVTDNSASGWHLEVDSDTTVTATSAGAVQGEANPGDTITINQQIPKNIRQIDFLVSIVKLFNLYVYEDKLDSRLIHFVPYVDFYGTNSTDSVDWTYKLNRDKVIKIKPMSELTAKKYQFKYKQDSDYYNELYRKRYGEGYGDYTYDSQFEFSEQTKSLELIFSATPLVGYGGQEKVYSTILKMSNDIEEQVDSNVRILQAKKVTGLSTTWSIKDAASTLVSGLSVYGYAGHLDDPDAPSNDLNFGALRELFFTLASGDLTATQFNVYYSAYMAEITDKDSKLMSAYFHLTAKDIVDLDFSRNVFIDGVLFKLIKINDYNATNPSDCMAELLKTNYLLY